MIYTHTLNSASQARVIRWMIFEVTREDHYADPRKTYDKSRCIPEILIKLEACTDISYWFLGLFYELESANQVGWGERSEPQQFPQVGA